MKSKVIKFIMISAALFLLAAMAACSKGDDSQKKESGKGQKTEKMEAPLTGLHTDIASPKRAVAVTINNHPAARPQSGLTKADIVYEVLAEGNTTRFLAIYQSEKPENVGPVRSARKYFIDLAKGYDSLYIAHGYSPEAKEMLKAGEIDHINGIQHDGTLFKRADFRKAPHNSYITFENIIKGAEEAGYEMDEAPKPLEFLSEKEAEDLQGEDGSRMSVAYSSDPTFTAEYSYDEKTQQYTRSSNGEQTAEYNGDTPVMLDNVLVIEAPHQVMDNEGRKEIDFQAGGKGYLLQRGKMQEVEWQNENGRILPYLNGEPLKFMPGKTWMNVVPELSIVSFE